MNMETPDEEYNRRAKEIKQKMIFVFGCIFITLFLFYVVKTIWNDVRKRKEREKIEHLVQLNERHEVGCWDGFTATLKYLNRNGYLKEGVKIELTDMINLFDTAKVNRFGNDTLVSIFDQVPATIFEVENLKFVTYE